MPTQGPSGGNVIAPRSGFSETWTPHNKRMHATADTTLVMLQQWRGAARDARRYAAVSPKGMIRRASLAAAT
jgi:hypothetical protein